MSDRPSPFLEITSPDGRRVVAPLTRVRTTIGRFPPPENDIALQPDPYRLVSRERQCMVEHHGSNWYVVCDGHNRNPTFLSRGAGLCVVQDQLPLADGNQIYIQGGLSETGAPLFWKCLFRDPDGTQPGRAAPYLEYQESSSMLFKVTGEVREHIRLSPREDKLMRYMFKRNQEHHPAPALICVEDLKQAVWGEQGHLYDGQPLHKLVASIRDKIEVDPDLPQFLRNEHGRGYLLSPHLLPPLPEDGREGD
ncbi:MAG TPA: winged helix-turn-helix domain-containing protein [Ktedonobacteraceae bacterium]